MAEFKITRFRYTWVGTWNADYSSTYNKDDVVLYQGKAWVCIRQHAPTIFEDDQQYIPPGNTNASPAWVKMTDGRKFLGEWAQNTLYDTGVLVLAGGHLYICVDTHTSSTNFSTNILDWELFATGNGWSNSWTPTTRYKVGEIVRYNGYTYQCVLEHTAGSIANGVIVGNNDAQDDSTFETWKVVVENYTYVGEYQSSTRYRKNDLVKYGGSILKCTQEHTSTSIPQQITNSNFVTYLSGFNDKSEWIAAERYAVGDVVQHGGYIYVAAANNSDSEPGITAGAADNVNWTLISKAVNFRGEYDPGTGNVYKTGDLVRRGGSLWVSLYNQVVSEDSSLVTLDDSNWELVITGYNFKGTWKTDEDYSLYDVVYFRGMTYYANTPHLSSVSNFPGDNGEGFNYWSILLVGDANAALTKLGDLLTFNYSREIIQDGSTIGQIGDGSTLGSTTVPIGSQDQLLYVENNQGDLSYKTWGNTPRVFFVRTTGVDDDDPNRGVNYFKPFRTLRFALEKADDGYQGTTTIKVSTGEYQEILPLIVPKKTAVVGEELRGVTIRASLPIAALANDAEYTLDTLNHIGLQLGDLIQGSLVIPTPGNNIEQIVVTVADFATSVVVNNLWANIIDTINFKINDEGTLPAVTGSNTLTTNQQRLNAVDVLENNREWIKEEAIAWMAVENPNYEFNTDKCRRDLDRFINAVQYDLQYPGNYKSTLAGRYYANAVTGSALEDMFYVRDTTGIRNLTLKGLEGTLPELAEGETYRIPTGGAFVSLDPGWGPDDERVWIIDRSCYIQNVTTFGTGAVGQKIDGLLHNGGNRSIVSNDFTQVISDGIGAWVQNGGRAELVSVFTYYAHIGMFAKDGGIIRATNGNSSYGDFGAVADGIDPDETVRYGKLNTRTEQAIVSAAFAGEILDFILALEFRNAGQEYSTASYTITSSGAGASAVQEEFRDNAMFECQTITAGSNYQQYGNQAQTGNATSITLATAETAIEADILGMRIIIISGEGTGQYGYVSAYNSTTKVLTPRRESDNQIGWDNILPGTPANSLLTTGTRYRIEPRPVFSAPPYEATVENLFETGTWANAVYGETSETFTAVTGTPGTGTTIEVTPAPAEFTIVKTARNYSVTLTDGGAGYSVGDTIVIDGEDIGGISVENDITITVTDVSDDSTNNIVAYEVSDTTIIADSGVFVITPTSGHFGQVSSDGSSWESMDLPSDGNWKCLAAGDNKFVAIVNSGSAAASSTNGVDWTARTMPSSRFWNAVIYGKPSTTSTGVFVAVAGNLNSGAYSTNGTTWTASSLPVFGDSTINQWVDIAFGNNKFVAIANSGNIAAVGTWNGTSLSWQGTVMDVIADSSQKDWVSITYGNRRFVAISATGDIAYSFDGLNWYAGTMPKQDGSTVHNWKKIAYGQGVFFAIGDTGSRTVGGDPTTGPTTWAVTSYDGLVWTERTLASSAAWGSLAFGNPDLTLGDSTVSNSKPTWVIVPSTSSSTVNRVFTGARALGRVVVEGTGVNFIKIWEPGSGYTSAPSLTITDPGSTVAATFRPRLADGVLAQPTFITKGTAYKTSTTFVTVVGDGFADITPRTAFITVDDLDVMPGPGAQFYIAGANDYLTAVIVGIDEVTLPNGKIRSTFRVSPRPTLADFLEHDMEILIREKYSQVRITGHDFLDIGTGNFEETNYPELYIGYQFTTEPFQEVQNLNGGRVFYTSTDQDGNFRAGEQFAVEQATGILTISADFFDLAGLTELRLSGINVGSTAVIREFSKDPLFLQNSNNVIPTQRAIRAYLQSRLNVGGEDLLTPSFIAGTVRVGPNLINSAAGLTIDIPVVADFSGAGVGMSGSFLAQTMFFRSFNPR